MEKTVTLPRAQKYVEEWLGGLVKRLPSTISEVNPVPYTLLDGGWFYVLLNVWGEEDVNPITEDDETVSCRNAIELRVRELAPNETRVHGQCREGYDVAFNEVWSDMLQELGAQPTPSAAPDAPTTPTSKPDGATGDGPGEQAIKLLQRIYDHFVEHGEWPLYNDLEIEMHDVAPLYQIISGIDESLLLYQWPIQESSNCFLTLKGIEKCSGSERDIQHFLRATDLFARRLIRDRSTATINNRDLVSELGMSESEAHRTCKLILQCGGVLWESASSSGDGRRHEFHVSRRALYFEGVSSLEDYFGREARAREAEKSEADRALRPVRAHDTRPTDHQAKLRQNIAEHFNLDELRTLCFDMGIKHENLAASTLDGMSRELVDYCNRTDKIRELVVECRKRRPNVSWEGKYE